MVSNETPNSASARREDQGNTGALEFIFLIAKTICLCSQRQNVSTAGAIINQDVCEDSEERFQGQ